MESDRTYSSNLSSKAALVSETEQVLLEYNNCHDLSTVRSLVIEYNLLLKRTESTRKRVWGTIYGRYFSDRPAAVIDALASIAASALPQRDRHHILFYELAQGKPLVYDLTTDCLYGLYERGRSSVTKEDIQAWLDQAEAQGHKEITGWSPQTRDKVASNYLTIARDFGLLEGTQRKTFNRVFVPVSTFVYVLYRLKDQGFNARAIVESRIWRLFLMDARDVGLLLEEATRAGYVTFQQAGDIYSLTFHYADTVEVVDELIRQVC
jgi:hypothetical protein